MTFVFADSRRRYGPNDLELAEDLCQRVALAMDNAQLYAEAQKLNAELEHRVQVRTDQLESANTRLIDEIADRRRAEEQVRILNAELEQRVAERTAQLESVNGDLQKEIVEHQEASRRLRALLERTRELYRVSQAIGGGPAPRMKCWKCCCPAAISRRPAALRSPFSTNPGSKRTRRPAAAASWPLGTETLSNLDSSTSNSPWKSTALLRPIPSAGRSSSRTSSPSHRLSENARQRFADLRTRSLIIFPLVAGGEWYGLLSVHFESRPRDRAPKICSTCAVWSTKSPSPSRTCACWKQNPRRAGRLRKPTN